MVYQLIFKDETVEIVERCWFVESRPRPGKKPTEGRWAVQRRAGTKLRWYTEEDIIDAKFETGDGPSQFGPPGPRKAG